MDGVGTRRGKSSVRAVDFVTYRTYAAFSVPKAGDSDPKSECWLTTSDPWSTTWYMIVATGLQQIQTVVPTCNGPGRVRLQLDE